MILITLQVRTVKMLPQAVCSMAVCENAAAGVHCMWASSYDGELTSWVIDELCVYFVSNPTSSDFFFWYRLADLSINIWAQHS